jgi:hypothetical protein
MSDSSLAVVDSYRRAPVRRRAAFCDPRDDVRGSQSGGARANGNSGAGNSDPIAFAVDWIRVYGFRSDIFGLRLSGELHAPWSGSVA